MAQLTCKNLTLGYDNRAIQEDLNFSIDAGDYLCIVGENGSGKSTLMKTLLHLQPPISGSIELGDGLKKNEIGYLPQQAPERNARIKQLETQALKSGQAQLCIETPYRNAALWQALLAVLQQQIALYQPFNQEVRLRTADGQWRWVEIRGQATPSPAGTASCIACARKRTSGTASLKAIQPSSAHLMRLGYWRTPARLTSLPSGAASGASSGSGAGATGRGTPSNS
mgnify:CR=1 FL=1